MNFLDTYGITGTGTSTPPPNDRQPEQSLNEEVSLVMGQLGRFWGGFRKQSEVALANARRDLGQVVTQAQREIEKLTTAETQPNPSEPEDSEEESDAEESADTPTADTTRPASTEPGGEESASGSSPTTNTTAHSFFARLQSSIPPNIVSAVQAQLPDSLKNAQNIDLAHLGSTLSSEFQRVQGVTRAQAEEYVYKSEVLLREAMKEAGDVLREAVKVIPPEAGSMDAPIIWDGADIWMLPGLAAHADGSTTAGSASKGKGKEVDAGPSSGRPSEDARRAVATRAESLLKQLRRNPEIIKLDPAVDTSADAYLAWADASEASREGFGTKVWGERIAEALSDPSDGATLQATFDALVPSSMPEEVFWIRYFFRVHQIEAEENRRKALLQGATAGNEDDFSWEDDEDESVSASDTRGAPTSANPLESSKHTFAPPRTTSILDVLSLPSSHVQSPRESSEDSFDVVSGNVSSVGVVEAEEEEEDGEEEEEEEQEEEEQEEEEQEEEQGSEGGEEEGNEGGEDENSDWD